MPIIVYSKRERVMIATPGTITIDRNNITISGFTITEGTKPANIQAEILDWAIRKLQDAKFAHLNPDDPRSANVRYEIPTSLSIRKHIPFP